MKTLTQHINEKLIINQRFDERLIINKNYKNVDDIESMLDNIEFEHGEDEELVTRDDIFSMMVEYIRDNNVRRFPDFYSYQKTATEDKDVCFAVFNNRIKEMDIFKKISNEKYKDFIIYQRGYGGYHYIFKGVKRYSISMHVLRNGKTWNNADDVEYYEISEETFEIISKLYDELFKKCEH